MFLPGLRFFDMCKKKNYSEVTTNFCRLRLDSKKAIIFILFTISKGATCKMTAWFEMET